VLFTQGGATLQFAMVPLNLAAEGDTADYLLTGSWSKKAIAEAEIHCHVNVAADASSNNFTEIPPEESWQRSDKAAYLHYTPNENFISFPTPEIRPWSPICRARSCHDRLMSVVSALFTPAHRRTSDQPA
jgi:phosphoserine aminotransferase